MHPAIRVLTLAALASGLPALGLPDLALLSATLLLAFGLTAAHALRRLGQGLWRLRWLLFAIGIVYWAYTPGEPLAESLPGLSREGALEGLRRALVLITLLIAVYLLLALTAIEDLLLAIRFLAAPLRLFGLDPQRLALRMALALDRVAQVQRELAQAPARRAGSLVDAAANAIREVEQDAGLPSDALCLRALRWPRIWEWPIPLALGIVLHGLGR